MVNTTLRFLKLIVTKNRFIHAFIRSWVSYSGPVGGALHQLTTILILYFIDCMVGVHLVYRSGSVVVIGLFFKPLFKPQSG